MNIQKNINIKICGITTSKSIKIAANNNIRSLGFASNNLFGPNTCDDNSIRKLIKECKEYKIESVLLSQYKSREELIKQIDYTKPKTISCSYYFEKKDLIILKNIFKRLRVGIAVNAKKFDLKYFEKISNLINVFYYDLNIYTKNQIHTFSIDDCKKQILLLKKFKKPIFIGGGINSKNVINIVNAVNPNGIDISRSLKDKKNNLCKNRLNKLLKILPYAA
tara:strand:+ start:160 stop:822 length:663 start_codon:yes stop_codon:yes gene_type:complete